MAQGYNTYAAAKQMSIWTSPRIYRLLLDDVLDDGTVDPRSETEHGKMIWKMAIDAERCAKAMGDIERSRKSRGLRA